MKEYQAYQKNLWQVAEIQVSYSLPIPVKDRIVVSDSKAAFDVFSAAWDTPTIEYKEYFYTLYLNKGGRVIGIHKNSIGGLDGVVVDIRQLFAVALKCNAAMVAIAHNHPSSVLIPSKVDIKLTKDIIAAAKFLQIQLIDHLILSKENYYSFADEGLIESLKEQIKEQ